MVQVLVNENDVQVVSASTLPQTQSEDFAVFGLVNGAVVRVPKSTIEQALATDNLVFSNHVYEEEVKEGVLYINTELIQNGDVIIADSEVKSIDISGEKVSQFSVLLSVGNESLKFDVGERTAYTNMAEPANGTFLVDVIATIDEEQSTPPVYYFKITEMTQL